MWPSDRHLIPTFKVSCLVGSNIIWNVCYVQCSCTQPSPAATGGWATANLPKYRRLTDSHPMRTCSMCLHSLRINFYVYSQFWQFYRLWPGRMVRAGSSRFSSGHQNFTSYRYNRFREGAPFAQMADGSTFFRCASLVSESLSHSEFWIYNRFKM